MITTLLFGLLGATQSFEERFMNPPAESRILPIIHTLPDEPEKQDELFDRLLKKGCGGITTNVSFGGGYVESEDRWKAFLRAVPEARRRRLPPYWKKPARTVSCFSNMPIQNRRISVESDSP